MPDINKVSEFLRSMQFYSFIKNINKILNNFGVKDTQTALPVIEQKPVNSDNGGQLGLFTQAIKETVEDIDFKCKILTSEDEVKDLADKLKTQAFAINTYSEKSNILGFSISLGGEDNYFVGGKYIEKLKPLLEDSNITY